MLRTLCTTRSNFHGKFGICSVKTYPTPGQHPYDLLLPIDFFSGCFQQLLLLPVGDLIFLVIASVRGNFFFSLFLFEEYFVLQRKQERIATMMPLARTFCVASRRRLLDRHATPLIVMKRAFATYPPHQVVGLPSLSPVRIFIYVHAHRPECNHRIKFRS